MTHIRYHIDPKDRWLAYIDVEDFPDINPDTDEGREDFGAMAGMIFFQNKAIQSVLIRRKGQPIGVTHNAGGLDKTPLQ